MDYDTQPRRPSILRRLYMQGIPDLEFIKRMSANAEETAMLRQANLVSIGILASFALVMLAIHVAASP